MYVLTALLQGDGSLGPGIALGTTAADPWCTAGLVVLLSEPGAPRSLIPSKPHSASVMATLSETMPQWNHELCPQVCLIAPHGSKHIFQGDVTVRWEGSVHSTCPEAALSWDTTATRDLQGSKRGPPAAAPHFCHSQPRSPSQ